MDDIVARVDALRRRAGPLEAYDLAMRAIEEGDDHLRLKHRAVLCLNRAGAQRQAGKQFEQFGLRAHLDDPEIGALAARLAKDQALAATGSERRTLMRLAATQYLNVYRQSHNAFAGINAATTTLLSARVEEARALAREIVAAGGGELSDTHDPYYQAATLAEAHLILDELAPAQEALQAACELGAGRHDDVVGTRRQLALICDAQGIDPAVLGPLASPTVVHYCGHRIGTTADARFPPADEATVAAAIKGRLEAAKAGFLYGSLASGADILFVEAAIAAGLAVHVVLPFRRDDFVRVSVADSGPGWVKRFEDCLAHEFVRVSYVTEDSFRGHDLIFAYATQHAMGLAMLQARQLDAPLRQITVWDGRDQGGSAGTAADIAFWTGLGHPGEVIAPPSAAQRAGAPKRSAEPPAPADFRLRESKALVFGDVKGFSKLDDARVPDFVEVVLDVLSEVMDQHAGKLEFRNTWGDGLFLVFSDVATAAACALEMQAAMSVIDFTKYGMPAQLALRLGGHFGLVFVMQDPVTRHTGYFGGHVNKAARIEPVTPPEEVYVSESFAARLALESECYSCEYVGEVASAKNYGRFRMYLLREA